MPLRHQGNAQDMAARERRTTPHFSCGGMGLRGRMTAGDTMSVDPTARLGALADARAGADLRRAVEMAARTVC